MSTALRYPIQRYTVDDYRLWEGDWELIDGIPVAMAPSPFGPHERCVDIIADALKQQLKRHHCDCHIYRNLDWVISVHDVVRPDLMIVCGEQPDRHLERTPELCIEVFSDSTRRHDQLVKRPFYRDHCVPFYILVEPGREWLQLCINNAGQEVEAIELCGEDRREITLLSGCELLIQPQLLLGK